MKSDEFIRRSSTFGCVILCCFLTLGPSGESSPIVATDGRGKRIELSRPPARIVSLAPALTEILFALGLKGRIVADTSQCSFPPEARSLPHIGDYRINVEQVVAQNPDLIVASSSANNQVIGRLESLGKPVFAVDPQTVAETYDAMRRIGRITGTDASAEKVIKGMVARIEATTRVVNKARNRPKVLVALESQPLIVVGGGNFMDDVVNVAGGVNVAAGVKGYPTYSAEKVVVDAPDVIIAHPETAAQLRRRAGWSGIPAIKNNAIFALPPDIFSRPGPRLPLAVEALARKLHPELFATRK